MSNPRDLVPLFLDQARGVRPQSEIEREARRLQKFAVGEGDLRSVIENAVFKGRVAFQRNSDESVRFNNDTGETQILIGTQAGINPFLAMGSNITDSGTGYTIKHFGLRGDAYYNGLMSTANVDISKWYCGCHHVPGDTTLEAFGMPAFTATGTITSVDSSSNSWASVTTAATTADFKGFESTAARFRTDQGYEMLFRVATGADISEQRDWVGVFETSPHATNTPIQNFAAFRYSNATSGGSGDTTWKCVTGDGASRTTTDSGIAVTADTSYYLRLRVTATSAMFSIGMPNVGAGTVNFTHTTSENLPTSTLKLKAFIRITAMSNNARSFLFGTFNALTR